MHSGSTVIAEDFISSCTFAKFSKFTFPDRIKAKINAL